MILYLRNRKICESETQLYLQKGIFRYIMHKKAMGGHHMKSENKIVLWGVTVLDGKKDMEPQRNRAVYIKDGKIEKITAADSPDKGYKVIDLTGQFLLPDLSTCMYIYRHPASRVKRRVIQKNW